MPDTPHKEHFLSRWSRLKSETQISDPQVFTPAPDDHPATNDHKTVTNPERNDDELSDAELLEKYALPNPDSMQAGDNFSVFMNRAVPDRLRRRALRVLWNSNPVLANLDELVDYGEDFTDAATIVENMQTVYQIGKGAAWKFKAEQERLTALEVAHEDDPEYTSGAEYDAISFQNDTDKQAEGSSDPITDENRFDCKEEDVESEKENDSAAETAPRPDTDRLPPLTRRAAHMRFEFD